MNNWTPSTIQRKAAAVADYAGQIDRLLWFNMNYPVADGLKLDREVLDTAKRLMEALKELNELDLPAIIGELLEHK